MTVDRARGKAGGTERERGSGGGVDSTKVIGQRDNSFSISVNIALIVLGYLSYSFAVISVTFCMSTAFAKSPFPFTQF